MPFFQETKKPKCFGMVDGTHIAIGCPHGIEQDENQYYCYKGYYSINTMVITDYDGVIMHVNASCPGSCNDIYVMNGSQIRHLGERGQFGGYYLLGDSGYMLTDYVLIPVKVEMTMQDVRYNKWHKKTRSKVERDIGNLKQRYRVLDSSGGYLFHGPVRAGRIIEACCCLHNCAKVGQVKILKDFKSKDGFQKVQPRIVQPENKGQKDPKKFVNMRKDFITEQFSRRAVAQLPNPV